MYRSLMLIYPRPKIHFIKYESKIASLHIRNDLDHKKNVHKKCRVYVGKYLACRMNLCSSKYAYVSISNRLNQTLLHKHSGRDSLDDERTSL